ncbi:hypothetical protein RJ641_029059, partial [Dillenia turbinata]
WLKLELLQAPLKSTNPSREYQTCQEVEINVIMTEPTYKDIETWGSSLKYLPRIFGFADRRPPGQSRGHLQAGFLWNVGVSSSHVVAANCQTSVYANPKSSISLLRHSLGTSCMATSGGYLDSNTGESTSGCSTMVNSTPTWKDDDNDDCISRGSWSMPVML